LPVTSGAAGAGTIHAEATGAPCLCNPVTCREIAAGIPSSNGVSVAATRAGSAVDGPAIAQTAARGPGRAVRATCGTTAASSGQGSACVAVNGAGAAGNRVCHPISCAPNAWAAAGSARLVGSAKGSSVRGSSARVPESALVPAGTSRTAEDTRMAATSCIRGRGLPPVMTAGNRSAASAM
jgi:hypothetical protein